MRLCVLSVDALPKIGGVSLMAHHLCNAFQRRGADVVFVGPRGTCIPAPLTRDYALYDDFDATVRPRDAQQVGEQDERIATVLSALHDDQPISRFLLVHPFYYGPPVIEFGRARGLPVSTVFHGYEIRSQMRDGVPDDLSHFNSENPRNTLAERAFYVVGETDELIVNSSYTKSVFGAFPAHPPIHVSGCGVDKPFFRQAREVSPRWQRTQRVIRREELGFGAAPMITFVGRLVPTKRAARLLDWAEADPGLQVAIVGDGPELDYLQDRVAAQGLAGRVHLTGLVEDDRKWEILHASDFLALLSEPDEEGGQVEGFGITLLEGAAAGAVPVTSGTGGMVDVVSDGQTGLVLPPGTASHDAVRKLLTTYGDEKLMGQLVRNARKQINDRYNWDAIAAAMLARWETGADEGDPVGNETLAQVADA